MKKIGLLTYHRACNYGAVLQAYSLFSVLKNMGNDVDFIDYYPQYLSEQHSLSPFKRMKKQSLLKKAFMLPILLEPVSLFRRRKKLKSFDEFIKLNYSLSNDFNAKEYDLFVLGSDQIWNPIANNGEPDSTFFGNFKNKVLGSRIISYAASLEKHHTTERFFKQCISFFKNFDSISVREKSLIPMLEPYTDLKIRSDVDPTVLNDIEFWSNFASKPKIDGDYILVYQVRRNKKTIELAKRLAQKHNLKVIQITTIPTIPFSGYVNYVASPNEFVGLFKYAKFIITSSFHGTVFSVIFNQPFYAIKMNDGADNRVANFLNEIKLSSRHVTYSDAEHLDIDSLNFAEANSLVTKMRGISLDYLKDEVAKN